MTAFKDLCDRADKHDLLVGLDATRTALARITLTTRAGTRRGSQQITDGDYDAAAKLLIEKHATMLA